MNLIADHSIPLATLPAYPSIPESLAFQLNGLIVVFIALGAIWGLMELSGVIFRSQQRRQIAAPVRPAAIPEKFDPPKTDNRMAVIINLLKEVLDIVEPPAKGSASFFHVLPAKPSVAGDTWTRSWQTASGSFNMAYILSATTDSTIIIDFTGSSVTQSAMEMMGQETTTTMNNKSSGKIVLDKKTGIIREQTVNLDGTGNTETAFGILPVTIKSSTLVTVARKTD